MSSVADPEPDSNRPPGLPLAGTTIVAVLLFAIAVLAGGDDAGDTAPKADAARAAPRAQGAAPAKPVSPAVEAAAAGMSIPDQVAQVFLVDGRGEAIRGARWGAVIGEAAPAPKGRRAVGAMVVTTDLPGQPALAARGPARVEREYRAAGRRLRAQGARFAVGLSADVAVTAGALADASFGDDPAEVGPLSRAALDGLTAARLPAAVGHFPGQGATTQDPLDGPANVGLSASQLERRDLVPFRAVVDRSPAIVVSSAVYPAFDGATPAALSPKVVRDELRGRLGFGGVAMTDDLATLTAATGGSGADAAVAALGAGIDLVMVGDEAQAEAASRGVIAALAAGELEPSRLREAVLRVLELKRRAGVLARLKT